MSHLQLSSLFSSLAFFLLLSAGQHWVSSLEWAPKPAWLLVQRAHTQGLSTTVLS